MTIDAIMFFIAPLVLRLVTIPVGSKIGYYENEIDMKFQSGQHYLYSSTRLESELTLSSAKFSFVVNEQ